MADDGAPHHFVSVPLGFSRLTHHFPNGVLRRGEIIRRPGQLRGKGFITVFEVRQINVDFPFQRPDGLRPLVAAAVVDHRHRQLWAEGGQNRGQVLGRGHEIDIFRTPGDQILKNSPQPFTVHRRTGGTAADGGVLAIFTAQGAAAEKHRAAAAASRQGRLFPFVEHGFCHKGGIRAAAESCFPISPVHAAGPGAQFAVGVIHESHILWEYDTSFHGFSQPPALPFGDYVVDYSIIV